MAYDAIKRRAFVAVVEAKKRARLKGVPVELTADDVVELLGDCRCKLTGIPFSLTKPEGATRMPWAPSVDRVIPSLGYTKDNCRFVCVAVNLAMNEWGEDVFAELAERYIKNRRTSLHASFQKQA